MTTYVPGTTLGTAFTNLQVAIPQGDGPNARNGSSVRMTGFHIKGYINNPQANLQATIYRVMIVKWGKLSGSTIVADQPLQNSSDVTSFRNTDPYQPFKVLYDKTFYLKTTASGNAVANIDFNYSYTPKNHHITWVDSDTAGTFANTTGGGISVLHFYDVATAAQLPDLNVSTRVTYVDN